MPAERFSCFFYPYSAVAQRPHCSRKGNKLTYNDAKALTTHSMIRTKKQTSRTVATIGISSNKVLHGFASCLADLFDVRDIAGSRATDHERKTVLRGQVQSLKDITSQLSQPLNILENIITSLLKTSTLLQLFRFHCNRALQAGCRR